jgi:hypothetical protein
MEVFKLRSKEKLVFLLLFLMFVATAGMFYYQNMYLKNSEMKDKQYVVVATKDIAKGATFKEGENYGVIAMDKKFIFNDYIKFDGTQKKILEGKKSNSAILKNEVLTKGRISQNTTTDEKTFRLFIKPDAKLDVAKGDRVNVYAQIKYKDKTEKDTMDYQTFLLLEDKVVENVVMKQDSRGADMKVMEYLEVDVSEQDAINYHLADYLTESNSRIIVLQYKNILDEFKTNVKPIEQMAGFQSQKDQFMKNQGDVKINTQQADQSNQK